MDNFNIIYGSVVRFKDKIPIFSYYVKLENNIKESIDYTLNLFFQTSSIGAFPGGREVLPFEFGIIYSIYNKNLTLVYIVITSRNDNLDRIVFSFIEDCIEALEDEIDFCNLEKLSKNKYSKTFLSVYKTLIKKYNADSENIYERFDQKIVRALSTINRGILASLHNKENLSKLQKRMNSLAVNAKLFQDKAHSVKKSVYRKWYKMLFYTILIIAIFILIAYFIFFNSKTNHLTE